MDIDWREDALCADNPDVQPDEWFRLGETRTYDRKHLEMLRSVCRVCPVQAQCLEWAIEHEPDWGVWAGTTPTDRAKLRRGAA